MYGYIRVNILNEEFTTRQLHGQIHSTFPHVTKAITSTSAPYITTYLFCTILYIKGSEKHLGPKLNISKEN